MSPLNLNPALTGVMDCNIRVIANYRNQWASVLKANAFNTYSASYEQKIPVGRADYFGIGGSRKLGENWSVGASMFVSAKSHFYSYFVDIEAGPQHEPINYSDNSYFTARYTEQELQNLHRLGSTKTRYLNWHISFPESWPNLTV